MRIGVRLPDGLSGHTARVEQMLRYADANHVADGIETITDAVDFTDDTTAILSVVDTDAVLRGVDDDTLRERNLRDHLGDVLCTFEYDGSRLTLGFHESVVDGEFRLAPAGHDAVGAVDQATHPATLASDLTPVLESLETEIDVVSYDVTDVRAGSMAHGGHFTDFEFEYVVTTLDV